LNTEELATLTRRRRTVFKGPLGPNAEQGQLCEKGEKITKKGFKSDKRPKEKNRPDHQQVEAAWKR